jgi:large subunit ribosomal protein L15
MLTLNNLSSPKGSNRNTKRIGRGQGSGWGTQAGKGHKGQKSTKSGGIPIGFEGGQMPLYRRLPKRGFSNAPFKTVYAEVNLGAIAEKFDSGVVNREALIEKGLLSGRNKRLPIKILSKGEFAKKLDFVGIEKFSAVAKEIIEKSGGKIQIPVLEGDK